MSDLLEIGVVKVKGGKITDRWSTFVKPSQPILGNQMHGITDKDVAKAPSPADAAKQAVDFIGDALVVGHNVNFDLGFLEEAGGKAAHSTPGRFLDTLTIAREGYPDLQNYKLDTLAAFFGVDLTQNHRALPDAEATANLLLWFADDLPGRIATLKSEISDSVRAQRTSKDEAKTKLERRAARPASARASGASSSRRPAVRWPSTRASGWTAAARRSSARSRSRSASCRAPTAPGSSPAARPRC